MAEDEMVRPATPLFSPACWEPGFQAWAQSPCPELSAQGPCNDSSATPSFPSQLEGKIGLPRVTSLAPHERLPEILAVPREKTPTGAAARGNP